ncbi:MAG TPA: vWA domain-containing protein, partial [Minicystis sp.]|nr:vWA domain-containing protein [Minicystis sp.]
PPPPPPVSPASVAPRAEAATRRAGAAPKPTAPPAEKKVVGGGAAAREEMTAPVRQAGVRAGEWDDNANYREFQKWLGTERHLAFHPVDVRDRHFLVVRDKNKKGVPRCAVTVRDEAQHAVVLTTTASGRALLFPHAERLEGELVATARCQGAERSVRFAAAGEDRVVDLELGAARSAPARTVDLGFVLDTTGSMSEEIQAVKATIQKVATVLGGEGVQVKVGLVEYKDRVDPFVTRVYPMTDDLAKFSRQVDQLSASGGGDYPESVNEGLHVALNRLDWGDGATVKMAVLVGDAPPHLDYQQDFDYAADMKDAAHRGIQVFTIAASGMDALGQVVWRQIAQYTDATNLFVMRGGAGPQSTGAGDPLASCGGTQTQYRSGNLDQLIVERVRRELRSVDADPMRIPGVGQDENAKPCEKRIQVAG